MLPKYRASTILTALMLTCCFAQADQHSTEGSLPDAVKKRIHAFNNHDLNGYLAAHHENVKIYEFPDRSVGVGHAHLKRIFGYLLERGIGKIEVRYQVTIDNKVISEEHISFGAKDAETIVAIYTVEDNLITSVYLVEPAN